MMGARRTESEDRLPKGKRKPPSRRNLLRELQTELGDALSEPRRGHGYNDLSLRDVSRYLRSCQASAHLQQKHERVVAEFMAKLAERPDSSTLLMKTLFRIWAKEYDQHMISTGHERAIDSLLAQMIALSRMGFGKYGTPMVGGRMLEMSCGTGSVINLLINNLQSGDELKDLRMIANDITPEMVNIARAKLLGKCVVDFTSQDIRQLDFADQFQTVMMAQTLHLIVDPNIFALELQQGGVMEKTDHRAIKTSVIRHAFSLLPEGGYFVLIDEWPPLFSNKHSDPLEAIVNPLFTETFRPIMDRSTLRDNVMSNVPGARFVFEGKARINAEHSMYIFVYVKDPLKVPDKSKLVLPCDSDQASAMGLDIGQVEAARDAAVSHILGGIRAVDPPFRTNYTPLEGETAVWAKFKPIREEARICSDDAALQSCMSGGASPNDSLVISRMLHKMDNPTRGAILNQAVEKLDVGGSLILVDEWPAPADSVNGIHKRDLRDREMEAFDGRLVFEASMRTRIMAGFDSGMYGYLYRKIR